MELSGLTIGDRVHNIQGTLVVTDHINKLEATVTYNPPKNEGGGMMKSLKSKLFKSKDQKEQQLSDYFTIQICQKALNSSTKKDKDKVVVSEGSGSWLEYVEFDGKVYWTVNDEIPQWLSPNDETLKEEHREFLLPSDSSQRPDLKQMLTKTFDQAEKEKHELEELQRKDKRLRQQAEKLRNKK